MCYNFYTIIFKEVNGMDPFGRSINLKLNIGGPCQLKL